MVGFSDLIAVRHGPLLLSGAHAAGAARAALDGILGKTPTPIGFPDLARALRTEDWARIDVDRTEGGRPA